MFVFKKRKTARDYEKLEALENIRIAHKQWKDKEKLFHQVSDPDLVDYAIFQLEASRLKYIYLLKKFKEEMNFRDKEDLDPNYMDILTEKNM